MFGERVPRGGSWPRRALVVFMLLVLFVGAACTNGVRHTASPSRAGASVALTATATPLPPTVTPTPTRTVTLAAVGDIMLARSIGERVLTDGPSVVFAGVAQQLSSADVTVGNLETSISNKGTPAAKGYIFRAPPGTAAALSAAGFDVVSQANNHALDYGPAALADTRQLVEAQGIEVVGAGADIASATRPDVIERNGLRIAFLGFVDTAPDGTYSQSSWSATATSPGVAWATPDAIRTAVQAAKAEDDIVVVMLHAGVEYGTTPTPEQEMLAETAIDAGASLVLGAHPHVLQPVVAYHGGVIAYSLGNFVFDGFDPPANTTAIFDTTLTPAGVQSWKLVPVSVVDGLPVLDGG